MTPERISRARSLVQAYLERTSSVPRPHLERTSGVPRAYFKRTLSVPRAYKYRTATAPTVRYFNFFLTGTVLADLPSGAGGTGGGVGRGRERTGCTYVAVYLAETELAPLDTPDSPHTWCDCREWGEGVRV